MRYFSTWTIADDTLLRNIVSHVRTSEEEVLIGPRVGGNMRWGEIEKMFNACKSLCAKRRTAKQCRERWVNYVNPDLNSQPYTLAEVCLFFFLES